MSAITDQRIRIIAFTLFVTASFIFPANLSTTYSYFSSKAGTVPVVLKTGTWNVQAEMNFILDTSESQTRVTAESENTIAAITAEVIFPVQVNLKDIDLKTISLEHMGEVIQPIAGSEQFDLDKLFLKFDREELAKLVGGVEGNVILTLSGKGAGFNFIAKGMLPLKWIETEEEAEDEVAEEDSIENIGDSKNMIPEEGEEEPEAGDEDSLLEDGEYMDSNESGEELSEDKLRQEES